MHRPIPAFAAAAGVALLLGCACRESAVKPGGAGPPAPDAAAAAGSGARVAIRTAEREVVFRVELARTPEERQRGLMYRTRLDADAGMLFLFEVEEPQSFWMKNTLIPLDMIFIGRDRRIVGIVENAEPQTLTPRRVPGVSQFVLEINGGLAARLGIRAGQPVDFLGLPP